MDEEEGRPGGRGGVSSLMHIKTCCISTLLVRAEKHYIRTSPFTIYRFSTCVLDCLSSRLSPAEKSELSTHFPLLHECGRLIHRWSISVLVVRLKKLPALYSKAGLRKMVSCGALRFFFLLHSSLWGPVRPRYFPSLIDSRGAC